MLWQLHNKFVILKSDKRQRMILISSDDYINIVSSPLKLVWGEGVLFLKFGQREGSWKNFSEIGLLVAWGGSC